MKALSVLVSGAAVALVAGCGSSDGDVAASSSAAPAADYGTALQLLHERGFTQSDDVLRQSLDGACSRLREGANAADVGRSLAATSLVANEQAAGYVLGIASQHVCPQFFGKVVAEVGRSVGLPAKPAVP